MTRRQLSPDRNTQRSHASDFKSAHRLTRFVMMYMDDYPTELEPQASPQPIKQNFSNLSFASLQPWTHDDSRRNRESADRRAETSRLRAHINIPRPKTTTFKLPFGRQPAVAKEAVVLRAKAAPPILHPDVMIRYSASEIGRTDCR